jgi:phosphoserine aminotransferase
MGLVFDWIIANGGVEEMEQRAIKKSNILYKTIDQSGGFYINNVEDDCRSRMNIVFRIKNDETLENDFCKEAKAMGLIGLKGHRSVGGIRASIYNAVLPEHAQRLVDFMRKFQEKHQ